MATVTETIPQVKLNLAGLVIKLNSLYSAVEATPCKPTVQLKRPSGDKFRESVIQPFILD